MSLIIKGMEMPKKQICIILNPNGLVEVLDANNILLEEYQAIPVQPHGDLINRKTAYDSLFSGMMMTGYQWRALDCISDFYVPTIIEAEEGE